MSTTSELDRLVQYSYETLKSGKMTFGDIVYLTANLIDAHGLSPQDVLFVVQTAVVKFDYASNLSVDERYVLSYRICNALEFVKDGLPALVDVLTRMSSK